MSYQLVVDIVNNTCSLHRENENICSELNTYVLCAIQLSKKKLVLMLSSILAATSNSISQSKDAAKCYSKHFNAVLKIWPRSCIDLYSRTESSFCWAVFEGEILTYNADTYTTITAIGLLYIFHGQRWTECFKLKHNFIFMWSS